MDVTLNPAALAALLANHESVVGHEVGLIAELVATVARDNATEQIIGVQSGKLLGGIQTEKTFLNGEAAYIVFTDAYATTKQGIRFYYPAWHDRAGEGNVRVTKRGNAFEGGQRPWLSEALEEVFTL